MPTSLTIDDVLVALTYCVIDAARALELELRFPDESYSLGRCTQSEGVVLDDPTRISAAQTTALSTQATQVLSAWVAQ
jgi:hypothetical protein